VFKKKKFELKNRKKKPKPNKFSKKFQLVNGIKKINFRFDYGSEDLKIDQFLVNQTEIKFFKKI